MDEVYCIRKKSMIIVCFVDDLGVDVIAPALQCRGLITKDDQKVTSWVFSTWTS